MFVEAGNDKTAVILMGDINARFGRLTEIIKSEKYEDSPDNGKNENAKDIINNVFETSSCIPLNHLIKEQLCCRGGITFLRSNITDHS